MPQRRPRYSLSGTMTPEKLDQLNWMIEELYSLVNAAGRHNLIDEDVHADTKEDPETTTTVRRGDLITGQGTPEGSDRVKWQRLEVGGNDTFLKSDGSDPQWVAFDHDHTSAAGDGGVLTNDEHDGFSEYTGIATPSTPAAGKVRLFGVTSQGHTQLSIVDQDGSVIRVNRDQVLLVRNTSGASIAKGKAIDIYSSTGQVPTVRLADASLDRHSEGLLFETVANNGYGLALLSGLIQGFDTSAFAEGAVLYLSSTGTLTATEPVSGMVQTIGVVTNSHATQGSIEVILGSPTSGASSDGGVIGHLHGLMRVLGDGATTVFNLLDIAEYVEHVGVNGSFLDPLNFTLSANRAQITFAVAPGAGQVITLEYVIAGL